MRELPYGTFMTTLPPCKLIFSFHRSRSHPCPQTLTLPTSARPHPALPLLPTTRGQRFARSALASCQRTPGAQAAHDVDQEEEHILYVDSAVTYSTILIKVYVMLEHAAELGARWILKTDDDAYVNVPQTITVRRRRDPGPICAPAQEQKEAETCGDGQDMHGS